MWKNELFLYGAVSFIVSLTFAVVPGNNYTQYCLLLYPSALFLLIGAARQIRVSFPESQRLIRATSFFALSVVLLLNANATRRKCRTFWTAPEQENDEKNYVIACSERGDTIAVISSYYSGFYIASGRDSATTYPYVQRQHFDNLTLDPRSEEAFFTDYCRQIAASRPRVILFDRTFSARKIIRERFSETLSDYVLTGKSTRLEFYILPRSPEEVIPAFEPQPLKKPSFTLQVTNDMWTAYQDGDLTLEDFTARIKDRLENP